jgi:hypothetical protein
MTIDLSKLSAVELVNLAAAVQDRQNAVGRELPPIPYAEALALICSQKDRTLCTDAQSWWDRTFTPIDVSLLADSEGNHDVEKWEEQGDSASERITSGTCALCDGTGRMDDEEECNNCDGGGDVYTVTDAYGEVHTFSDSDDAEEKAQEIIDSERESRAGFPFAWNTGWTGDNIRYWLADLQAAGFIVYVYDGGDTIVGIDGAGYSFLNQHFAPVYLRIAARNGWLVQTNEGPRLVAPEGGK